MSFIFSKFSKLGSGAKPLSPNPSPLVTQANQLFEPTHSFWAGYATDCDPPYKVSNSNMLHLKAFKMHQINTKISTKFGMAQPPPQTSPPFCEINKPTFHFASLFLNPGYGSAGNPGNTGNERHAVMSKINVFKNSNNNTAKKKSKNYSLFYISTDLLYIHGTDLQRCAKI